MNSVLISKNDIGKYEMILCENVFLKSQDKPIFKPRYNFDV